MKFFRAISTTLLFSILFTTLGAQSSLPVKLSEGLIMHYNFDTYPLTDISGNGTRMILGGDSTLNCGVLGNALRFDGTTSDAFLISPLIIDNFRTADFSLSFYMKSSTNVGNSTLDLFSKKKRCTADSSFSVKFTPSSNKLTVELIEKGNIRSIIEQRLDFGRCWQHIVIVRRIQSLLLYVNGRLVRTTTASKRVAITNDAPFSISRGPCVGSTDKKFLGTLDEVRLYDRSLNEVEVDSLYLNPDRLRNRIGRADTIITFLGNSTDVDITSSCATDFSWKPTEGVADPKSPKTTITPTSGGVFKYVLSMKDAQCSNPGASDTLIFKVIDPKDLTCTELFVPSAFTPNGGGPFDNEKLGISNPFAIDDLISFEVLDAWGGRVFFTQDKFGAWDGTFNGQALNPGVYLWRAKFKCEGQEKAQFGSVTLIK